jgi:hypothetical protein
MLLHLVRVHGEQGTRGVGLDELVEAGWPSERIQAEAAASRVYTAIKTLRDLGLGRWLLRRDDGYLLDPDLRIDAALL